MGESGNGYWLVLARLITNRNLTLETFVAGPLNRDQVQRAGDTYDTTRNDTNDNADMCCRILPERCELLCVVKIMTSTQSRSFQGKTKSPVHTLEENGQLQHRLFNVPPVIVKVKRGPHCLGNHRASVYDSAVEKPRRRVECY